MQAWLNAFMQLISISGGGCIYSKILYFFKMRISYLFCFNKILIMFTFKLLAVGFWWFTLILDKNWFFVHAWMNEFTVAEWVREKQEKFHGHLWGNFFKMRIWCIYLVPANFCEVKPFQMNLFFAVHSPPPPSLKRL